MPAPTTTDNDRFISRNAAAKLRGVTRQRIDTAIRTGALQSYEVAGRVVVRESDALSVHIPTGEPPAGLLTRAAAARILGTYSQRVEAMIARGELTAVDVDGVPHLREVEVRAAATPKPIPAP